MTMLNIPIQFDDLLKVVDMLTPEQRRVLAERIAVNAKDDEVDLSQPRILGLHPGAIWTSDDFDEPLPDEFWLSGDPS
jgi:hypothetical protein